MLEPLPSSLHSEDSGRAHEHCKICNKAFGSEEIYGIQKVYKNYPGQGPQVLFDFALCQSCMQEARAELSVESRLRIDEFMMQRLHALAEEGIDPKERYLQEQCTLTGKSLTEAKEYQLVAVCQGEHLMESPLVLSDEILEAIQELLSDESRDELNRFNENNFGWPPELQKIWQDGDYVLL